MSFGLKLSQESGVQNMESNRLEENYELNKSLIILENLVNIELNKIKNEKILNENKTQQTNVELLEKNQSTTFNMNPIKVKEECTINERLIVMESLRLVNIELDKLENQKRLSEYDTQQPNVKLFDNNQSTISNMSNIQKKRNRRSKNKENKIVDNEEFTEIKVRRSSRIANRSINSLITKSPSIKKSKSMTVNCNNKFKRLNVNKSHDEIQVNDVTNVNLLSNNACTIKNEDMRTETLENLSLENNSVDTDIQDESTSEWMKRLFVLHNIKPLYVVINPNITYD